MVEPANERAYASVRFMGPTLDPLDITKALELPPDNQHRHGEPRLTRSREGKVKRYADYSAGLWAMSSRQWVDSPLLETHLDWLLSQLEPRRETIRDLLASGVDADFFCFLGGSAAEPPPVARAVRERAELLGIPIEIDYYQDPEPEDS